MSNIMSASITRLPKSWSIILLNARQVASRINVYTDETMGCAFQFDVSDPSEAIGMAQR
jgi:hypothetical protein